MAPLQSDRSIHDAVTAYVAWIECLARQQPSYPADETSDDRCHGMTPNSRAKCPAAAVLASNMMVDGDVVD